MSSQSDKFFRATIVLSKLLKGERINSVEAKDAGFAPNLHTDISTIENYLYVPVQGREWVQVMDQAEQRTRRVIEYSMLHDDIFDHAERRQEQIERQKAEVLRRRLIKAVNSYNRIVPNVAAQLAALGAPVDLALVQIVDVEAELKRKLGEAANDSVRQKKGGDA